MLASHTFLFIGFSLNDVYFLEELHRTDHLFEGNAGPHYVLVVESERDRFGQLEIPSSSVKPIFYPDHGEPLLELIRLMGSIAQHEEESQVLLAQEAGRGPSTESELTAAQEVALALGGLPLALELAGAYLRYRGSVTWEAYRDLLRSNLELALPSHMLGGSFTQHEKDIFATLKIDDALLDEVPLLGAAFDILTWSGAAPMGTSLLAHLLGVDSPDALIDALDLGESLRILQRSSESDRFAIHPLVREVRRRDTPLEGREAWVETGSRSIGHWFEERRKDFGDLAAFEVEVDHLAAWQNHALAYVPSQSARLTWLQGYPPFHRGKYVEAREYVARALRLHQQSGEEEPVLLAHVLNDNGATEGLLGQDKKALGYAEKALSIRREVLGERHPDTATALSNLGAIYSDLGQHQKALGYEEQALSIRREVLGERHPDTATAVGSLGTTYVYLGQYQEALRFHEQALSILGEVLGERHPSTATALSNLGATYSELGQHAKAVHYDEQALSIRREVLGERHPVTVNSLGNLGTTYSYLGQHQKALGYEEQALSIRREVLGERHPDTATALSNLGATYSELGQHPKAVHYHEQALSIRREVLGERHPDTATSLGNLGAAYSELGQHQEALRYKEQALSIRREVLGERHPDTANSLSSLAFTHTYLVQHEEALRYLERALSIRREVLGERHPDTANSLSSLAFTHTYLVQHEEALRYLERALSIRLEVLGEHHPDTVRTLLNLVTVLSELKRIPDAMARLRAFHDELPADHPSRHVLTDRIMGLMGEQMGGGFRNKPTKGRAQRKNKKGKRG